MVKIYHMTNMREENWRGSKSLIVEVKLYLKVENDKNIKILFLKVENGNEGIASIGLF
jgi:hypothetical protein